MNKSHDSCMGCIREMETTSRACRKCKYNYKGMYVKRKDNKGEKGNGN